jgi:hypothetical protein
MMRNGVRVAPDNKQPSIDTQKRRKLAKMLKAKTAALLIAGSFLLSSASAAADPVELEMTNFSLGGARSPSFKIISNRHALCMEGGTALVVDREMRHGTISVDVQNSRHRHFAHLVFRAIDADDHESVYLRMHKDGQLDAIQYSPHIRSEANWQLFGPYQTRIDFGDDEWVTLRAAFAGDKANISVITSTGEYSLHVDDLALDASGARFGLSALFPTCFSNLQIESDKPDLSMIAPHKYELSAGVITSWYLSPSSAFNGVFDQPPALDEWEMTRTDANGTLVISRYRTKESRGEYERNNLDVVYAGVHIKSDENRVVPLNFDVSDIGRVYLNGRPLAELNNSFRAKTGPLFRGDFDRSAQTIMLPLEAGMNELVFAISERANGWGLSAELLNMDGLELLPIGGEF